MCRLKYVLNCEQYFFIFHISIRINCNRISEGLLFIFLHTYFDMLYTVRTSFIEIRKADHFDTFL
jgi:hypothetical protein